MMDKSSHERLQPPFKDFPIRLVSEWGSKRPPPPLDPPLYRGLCPRRQILRNVLQQYCFPASNYGKIGKEIPVEIVNNLYSEGFPQGQIIELKQYMTDSKRFRSTRVGDFCM